MNHQTNAFAMLIGMTLTLSPLPSFADYGSLYGPAIEPGGYSSGSSSSSGTSYPPHYTDLYAPSVNPGEMVQGVHDNGGHIPENLSPYYHYPSTSGGTNLSGGGTSHYISSNGTPIDPGVIVEDVAHHGGHYIPENSDYGPQGSTSSSAPSAGAANHFSGIIPDASIPHVSKNTWYIAEDAFPEDIIFLTAKPGASLGELLNSYLGQMYDSTYSIKLEMITYAQARKEFFDAVTAGVKPSNPNFEPAFDAFKKTPGLYYFLDSTPLRKCSDAKTILILAPTDQFVWYPMVRCTE